MPQTSGEAEPALRRRVRRNQPRTSGEAEPTLRRRVRQSPTFKCRVRRSLPQTSGEADPALGHWARRSLPSDVGQGGASPGRRSRWSQPSVVWAKSVATFLSVWKHQRLMVISSTSLGTLVFGPRHHGYARALLESLPLCYQGRRLTCSSRCGDGRCGVGAQRRSGGAGLASMDMALTILGRRKRKSRVTTTRRPATGVAPLARLLELR